MRETRVVPDCTTAALPDHPDITEDPAFASALANMFSRLLTGHMELARRAEGGATSPLITRFSRLLRAFSEARNTADAGDRTRSAEERGRFLRMLTTFRESRERHRRGQEAVADDFNILNVLQLTGKEVRHSMVLAWLLDREIERHGTHAQGPLGFRLFLREFGLPDWYADAQFWVRREVAGDESIVDIEVAARGQFVIHIENKIWSGEGNDQTNREWLDLLRRAESLGIDPSQSQPPVHAFFLTPSGLKATNSEFVSISWRRIVRVLELFAGQAQPTDVQLFAAHYARAIRSFAVSKGTGLGKEDDDHAAIE